MDPAPTLTAAAQALPDAGTASGTRRRCRDGAEHAPPKEVGTLPSAMSASAARSPRRWAACRRGRRHSPMVAGSRET
jgi:hypothetical protein